MGWPGRPQRGLLKTLAFGPEKQSFLPFAQVNGLVAQLEERLNGIEEVVSSNLIGSTTYLSYY
jgi:hypothetical protein